MQIESKLKKNPNRWRIFAYKFGDEVHSRYDGHAMAIRYNSNLKKIEFVENDGYLIDSIREDLNGLERDIPWTSFDFLKKKKVYLFVYKNGFKEFSF